jgi:hypothetical protein
MTQQGPTPNTSGIAWHRTDDPRREAALPPVPLLPCPFDGGTRLKLQKVDRFGESRPEDPDAFAYNVFCTGCATEGPWVKNSPTAACDRWNRRSIHGIDLTQFVLHEQDKSTCSDCGRQPLLLAPTNPEFRLLGSPAFFWLCPCGAIRQSGNSVPIQPSRTRRRRQPTDPASYTLTDADVAWIHERSK